MVKSMKSHKMYRTAAKINTILIIVMLIGLYSVHLFSEGVLAVYARQQDAFVKLVLDQINIKGDDATADDITAIISTMDSSDHKYWTLSEDNSLIFVKNINETNRYKGFTSETFFASDAGLEFLNDMKLNHVSHDIVNLDDERYVVSGAVFSYRDKEYTLCLLTDSDVIIQENSFLFSKIMTSIVLAVSFLTASVAMVGMAHACDRIENELKESKEHAEELNVTIAKLNHRITRHDMFHPRWNLYEESVLDSFLEGFVKKGVRDFGFTLLRFRDEERRNDFLEEAFVYLNKKVLRFSVLNDPRYILLLFVNEDESQIHQKLGRLYLSDKEIIDTVMAYNEEDPLKVCIGMLAAERDKK